MRFQITVSGIWNKQNIQNRANTQIPEARAQDQQPVTHRKLKLSMQIKNPAPGSYVITTQNFINLIHKNESDDVNFTN